MADTEPFTVTLTCTLCGKTFNATVPIVDMYETAISKAYAGLTWHQLAWCDGLLKDRVSVPLTTASK